MEQNNKESNGKEIGRYCPYCYSDKTFKRVFNPKWKCDSCGGIFERPLSMEESEGRKLLGGHIKDD